MSNDKSNFDEENQPITLEEHLSSVLDDEAGSFEERRVLDELKSSEELSNKLSHFAFIGESMRSTNPTAVAGPSFLAGIHEQISSEDEYNDVQVHDAQSANDASNQQNSWFRPLGGFAVAASFAAMAFMGVQNYKLNNQLAEQATIIANQPAQTDAMDVQAAVANTDDKVIIDSNNADTALKKQEYRQANIHARSFLKRYVDSHVQYASASTFVPSVRVIAYADY